MHTWSPSEMDVAAARRLLGLDAAASQAEIDAAVAAARAAIRVPDGAPDLAATAAHLHRRLDHARAVLVSTLQHSAARSPVPPAPLPPPPPLEPRSDGTFAAAPFTGASHPDAEAVHPRAASAARATKARQKRAEHTRAGVHAVVLVVLLLVLGGAAFAITRALSRNGPTAQGSTTTITTSATPTTVIVRAFTDRLVAGELGRPPEGLDAVSAQAALHAWLAGFQSQDAGIVAHGIDDESRLMDLAEIGSRSSPTDLDAITCNPFGNSVWRCKAGAVTAPSQRIEVTKTPGGWRIRGWIG